MSGPSQIARSLTTRMNRKKSVTDGAGNTNSSSSGMGLSRAFSMRKPEKHVYRPEISLPIELLSATNPLAFNAPDLPHLNSVSNSATAISPVAKQLNAVASSNSLRSESSVPALSSAASTTFTFSDVSTPTDELAERQLQDLQSRLASTPQTPADAPASPQSVKSSKSTSSSKFRSPVTPVEPAPAIPQRAPSHTKKTHQALARRRSASRMRSETESSTPSLVTDDSGRQSTSSSQHQSTHSSKAGVVIARSSAEMFSARSRATSIDVNHPFGAELAKLTEIAEEFSPRREKAEPVPMARSHSGEGAASQPLSKSTEPTPQAKPARKQRPTIEPTVWDEEQEYLAKHGLNIFSAEEYMAEIGSPYDASFPVSVY